MQNTSRRKTDLAGVVIAGILLVLAAVIAWDAYHLTFSPPYGLGPKAAPFAVSAGLTLLAIGNLIMGLRGELPERETVDMKAIGLVLAGLIALIAIIGLNGGFIAATTVLFTTTSTAFGRRAVLTDLAIGIALGVVIYLMFDKLLTLSLPAGPIEHGIDSAWKVVVQSLFGRS